MSAPTLPWYHHPDRNCAGMDADDVSVSTCGGCPVVFECLESALREEGGEGVCYRFLVRGGLYPDQRWDIAMKRGMVRPSLAGMALGECLDCQVQLIPHRMWVKADRQQRARWRDAGLRENGGYSRCTAHAEAHKRRIQTEDERERRLERRREYEARRKAREAA